MMGKCLDQIAFQARFPPGKDYSYDNIQLGFMQGLRMVAN
jgi:hypothetical protein